MDQLRDRIAAVLREHVEDQLTNYDAERNECGCGNQGLSGYKDHVADAVLEMLTVHIPPIVASAIHGYADSQIVALDYHGDGSAIEEMRRLNSEAAQIANYATTHERWNGGQSS